MIALTLAVSVGPGLPATAAGTGSPTRDRAQARSYIDPGVSRRDLGFGQ